MTGKDVIWAVLRGMECKPIMKSKLQTTLQAMLETENELEDGDNDGKWDNSFYFTNGEADSTHNFCDIRIDYLPTNNEGEVYVTGTEILDYQN